MDTWGALLKLFRSSGRSESLWLTPGTLITVFMLACLTSLLHIITFQINHLIPVSFGGKLKLRHPLLQNYVWSYMFEMLALSLLNAFLSCASWVSVQFSSVTKSCPTLCDPIDCSTPGLPVHHQLPELTQTHDHWVSDDIQPSHLLSFPSPSAFDLSQHQGLFQWVSSSH